MNIINVLYWYKIFKIIKMLLLQYHTKKTTMYKLPTMNNHPKYQSYSKIQKINLLNLQQKIKNFEAKNFF